MERLLGVMKLSTRVVSGGTHHPMMRPRVLRIAMVAPPYYTVPPDGYGGIEAVVAGLVDRLVARGHQVTLFAAGARGTGAQEFVRTSERTMSGRLGEAIPEVVNAARVFGQLRSRPVDIVHDHTIAGALTASGRAAPTLVTVHGSAAELADVYRPLGRTVSLVAISHAQRASEPGLNWVATVHNGIDVRSFPYRSHKDDYVLFIGRFHPQKAPHLAIDAARRAGVRIILAGKCTEPVEHEYYRTKVAPLLGRDAVDVGIADGALKRRLLAGARCLLFPICWAEPFGLVMVEAMACGTPVVALSAGSAREVVAQARTGFVVERPEQLARAITDCERLEPSDCRRLVSERFSLDAMAAAYERTYRRVLEHPLAQRPGGRLPQARAGG
ncbi:glycosyltransferase family 4 protein [Terrabacter terrae]|uniref:Glycosyltransferase family 4 protein n=1 Tax=Terrabacter terrae TaxID=318434 RepID=A0ABN2TYG0_9MICO